MRTDAVAPKSYSERTIIKRGDQAKGFMKHRPPEVSDGSSHRESNHTTIKSIATTMRRHNMPQVGAHTLLAPSVTELY